MAGRRHRSSPLDASGTIYTPDAFRLINESNTLLAPDLIYAEVGNIIWKKVKRGELTREEGRERIGGLLSIPITAVPAEYAMEAAYEFAVELDRTVYDSLYVAIAVQGQIQLVTADLRLHNVIEASRYAGRSLWIEDIPGR